MGYHKDSTNSKYFLKNQLLTLKKELNMFLVPTFCGIVKNAPYIIKMVKKKSHKFFRYQEWSIPPVFQRNAYL
jgi:hypothetical protein